MFYHFSNALIRPKFLRLQGHLTALASGILMVISATVTQAGYGRFSQETIDYYDETSGYYYRSITAKGKSSGFLSSKIPPKNISNIFLFNPVTSKGHLLFADQNDARRITLFAHENEFITLQQQRIPLDEKPSPNNKIISFHNYGNVALYNNIKHAKKRPLRDHILIALTLPKTEQTELWHSKKDGSELKKLITVSKKSHWHIDLKAMKIRVFVPDTKLGYKVTSYEW